MKKIAISLVIGTLCAVVAPPAGAAPPQPSTGKYYVDVDGHMAPVNGSFSATLTFSAPVQLPKVKLEPGTYVFTAITPSTIRVTSENGKKVYTMFNTLSASRHLDVHRAQIRFEKTSPTATPRVIGLFPEGSTLGFQPMYPKAKKTI